LRKEEDPTHKPPVSPETNSFKLANMIFFTLPSDFKKFIAVVNELRNIKDPAPPSGTGAAAPIKLLGLNIL
jgi:hypothetical protein